MAAVAEVMAIAARHHSSGNLAEAEGIYRQVLAVEPANAEASNGLGTVYLQQDRHRDAIEHFSRAIAVNPDMAVDLRRAGPRGAFATSWSAACGWTRKIGTSASGHVRPLGGMDAAARRRPDL